MRTTATSATAIATPTATATAQGNENDKQRSHDHSHEHRHDGGLSHGSPEMPHENTSRKTTDGKHLMNHPAMHPSSATTVAHKATDAAHAADTLVVFGATGDQARLHIYPALYAMCCNHGLRVPVIGVDTPEWNLEQLRAHVRHSVMQIGGDIDLAALEHLLSVLRYTSGSYHDASTYDALRQAMPGAQHAALYLATPPDVSAAVIRGVQAAGLHTGARLVMDKPFGRDLASAQALNAQVRLAFAESAVFRIDHFLGKEAIMNVLYARFANALLEPIWSRTHIASVQITLAERAGVGERGTMYEAAGCLRDVVHNQLFQVVALLAMEAPASRSFEAVQRQKANVLASMRPLTAQDVVRGQYQGYHSEPCVANNSDVDTYCAVRVHIDSWRWSGVPWYLRAGKAMPTDACEVLVRFKPPPHNLFGDALAGEGSNTMRFRLSPNTLIAMGARFKRPGRSFVGDPHECVLQEEWPDPVSPHARLLSDAMAGDTTLFTSEQAIEAAWAVVEPVLHAQPKPYPYAAGSWGPDAATHFIAMDGGWHNPT
jgi:glucose-6-phosphate 1-dehydrogenase